VIGTKIQGRPEHSTPRALPNRGMAQPRILAQSENDSCHPSPSRPIPVFLSMKPGKFTCCPHQPRGRASQLMQQDVAMAPNPPFNNGLHLDREQAMDCTSIGSNSFWRFVRGTKTSNVSIGRAGREGTAATLSWLTHGGAGSSARGEFPVGRPRAGLRGGSSPRLKKARKVRTGENKRCTRQGRLVVRKRHVQTLRGKRPQDREVFGSGLRCVRGKGPFGGDLLQQRDRVRVPSVPQRR